jgi:hypothetical protein
MSLNEKAPGKTASFPQKIQYQTKEPGSVPRILPPQVNPTIPAEGKTPHIPVKPCKLTGCRSDLLTAGGMPKTPEMKNYSCRIEKSMFMGFVDFDCLFPPGNTEPAWSAVKGLFLPLFLFPFFTDKRGRPFSR